MVEALCIGAVGVEEVHLFVIGLALFCSVQIVYFLQSREFMQTERLLDGVECDFLRNFGGDEGVQVGGLGVLFLLVAVADAVHEGGGLCVEEVDELGGGGERLLAGRGGEGEGEAGAVALQLGADLLLRVQEDVLVAVEVLDLGQDEEVVDFPALRRAYLWMCISSCVGELSFRYGFAALSPTGPISILLRLFSSSWIGSSTCAANSGCISGRR
jgi:hypothetical protein